MDQSRVHEGMRRMRFESVLDRQDRGEPSQLEAAEMLGASEQTFRRWHVRFREGGPPGLSDRRLGRPSGHKSTAASFRQGHREHPRIP
jgi:transposase